MTRTILLLWALLWPLSEGRAQIPSPPPDQGAIAADLRTADIPTIERGMIAADSIPHQEWSPELRSAILYALEAEIQRDIAAKRAGKYRFADENLSLFLYRMAIVLEDPAAIPSLILLTGGFDPARSALAAWGRQALPQLIDAAASDGRYSSSEEYVVGCLRTLRYMVEHWGLGYFTAAERAEMKAVTDRYLSPETGRIHKDAEGWTLTTKYLLVQDAAFLAMALEDSEARAWIERLGTDSEAFKEKIGGRSELSKREAQRMQVLRAIAGGKTARPFDPLPEPLSKLIGQHKPSDWCPRCGAW